MSPLPRGRFSLRIANVKILDAVYRRDNYLVQLMQEYLTETIASSIARSVRVYDVVSLRPHQGHNVLSFVIGDMHAADYRIS
jgi:hypothetical protein